MARRLPSRERAMGTRLLVPLLARGDQLFDVDEFRGIVTGVTCVAVFVALIVVDGFAQRGQREISQGISLHETANLLHAVAGGDQLAARGRIDTVETGRDGRRAGDP